MSLADKRGGLLGYGAHVLVLVAVVVVIVVMEEDGGSGGCGGRIFVRSVGSEGMGGTGKRGRGLSLWLWLDCDMVWYWCVFFLQAYLTCALRVCVHVCMCARAHSPRRQSLVLVLVLV